MRIVINGEEIVVEDVTSDDVVEVWRNEGIVKLSIGLQADDDDDDDGDGDAEPEPEFGSQLWYGRN